jgi:hypothetical protein
MSLWIWTETEAAKYGLDLHCRPIGKAEAKAVLEGPEPEPARGEPEPELEAEI